MPAKFDPNSPENASLISLFTSLGLSANTAAELVRQSKSAAPFKALIDECGLEGSRLDEKRAGALVKLGTSGGNLGPGERGFVVGKIVKGDVKTPDQVAGEYALQVQTAFVTAPIRLFRI